jgi:hypothetical protein
MITSRISKDRWKIKLKAFEMKLKYDSCSHRKNHDNYQKLTNYIINEIHLSENKEEVEKVLMSWYGGAILISTMWPSGKLRRSRR